VNKEGILLSRRTRKEITVKMYIVDLDERERNELEQLTTKGRSGARKIRRARILLLADEGRIDKEIASFLGSAVTSVERVRKRFVEEGLEAALSERPRPGAARKLDGRQEAFLMALACSDVPEGKGHWSMRMLAQRLVELEVVDEISDETVRRTLKRGTSSHG
jgi:transposase